MAVISALNRAFDRRAHPQNLVIGLEMFSGPEVRNPGSAAPQAPCLDWPG